MALKRLDEEFELKPGTQLLPYMQRLLPSLEGRFQQLEASQDIVNKLTEEIRAAALMRMNEILIPATEDIIAVTKLGFLLAPVSTPYKLVLGYMAITVDDGPQRKSFTPSPYLIIEHSPDDYGIARLIGYHQEDGLLEMNVTAIHGSAGPWDDWMVSSTPGMADSTKLYHDEVGPWRDEVAADYAAIVVLHQEIIDAANALASSGLDAYAFIRRDGTVPFIALQTAVPPPVGSNDTTIPTTAWSRSRMIEYVSPKVNRSGDTMTGALSVPAPTQPSHAVPKSYVDSASFSGVLSSILTITMVNPTIRLQTTGTGQGRIIEGRASNGVPRWQLQIGDAAGEGGNNTGSNFAVLRYNDGGAYLGTPFSINRVDGSAVFGSGGVTVQAGINCTAINVSGDVHVYRPGGSTGVVYLNQSNSAYHYFDGATHVLSGGGLSTGAVGCGGITCTSINTQGYGITVGGITNTGAMSAAGAVNVGSLQVNSTACYVTLNDTDWGPMHIHHNGDNIGFLNSGGAWSLYTNNAGQLYIAAYGWLHDYVNGTASNYAWSAANSKDGAINNATNLGNQANTAAYNAQVTANNGWNQAVYATNLASSANGAASNAQNSANDAWNMANARVSDVRFAYAGDKGMMELIYTVGDGSMWEPFGGAAITGFSATEVRGVGGVINGLRFRYLQIVLYGQWYTVGYA